MILAWIDKEAFYLHLSGKKVSSLTIVLTLKVKLALENHLLQVVQVE